jgi:glucans biosynthesis protein C
LAGESFLNADEAQPVAALQQPTARRADVDWLRAIAVVLLVPFHGALIFTPGGIFSIKSGEDVAFLGYLVGFMHQWHMPLLFVLSGAATCFALDRRAPREYVGERAKRLLVPFVFGTFVLVPICSYYENLNTGSFDRSYLAFYPRFFNGFYPTGNFTWSHLWFIAYLFVFSMISLPVFVRLRAESGRRLISHLATFCERRGGVLLLAIPIAVSEAALRPRWPGLQNLIDDWANFVTYDFLFILGFVVFADVRFRRALDRDWPLALALGIAATSFGIGLAVTGNYPSGGYTLGQMLFMILRGFNMWSWILALMGLASRFLDFGNGGIRYVRDASYPFYILHYLVLTIIGYYLAHWNVGVASRYTTIVAVTTIATIVCYDVFVRRTNVTRFLFGMRPIKRKQ